MDIDDAILRDLIADNPGIVILSLACCSEDALLAEVHRRGFTVVRDRLPGGWPALYEEEDAIERD